MSGIQIGTCFGREGLLLKGATNGRSKESCGEGRSLPVDDESGLAMGIAGVISWTPLDPVRSRVNDTHARDEREWGLLGFFAGRSRSKKDELKDHDSDKEEELLSLAGFLGLSA